MRFRHVNGRMTSDCYVTTDLALERCGAGDRSFHDDFLPECCLVCKRHA